MIDLSPMVPCDQPLMTDAEVSFLEAKLTRHDRVWEWGSGASTRWLARRVKYVTTVEHQRHWLTENLSRVPDNVSLLYVPCDLPERPPHDGDLDTFRRYVEIYTGRGIDVVFIDGRARVACARQVADAAEFAPGPDTRIFLHDCDRGEYSPIWETYFHEVERVERLMLLEAR